MTLLEPARSFDSRTWPGLDVVPTGPRAAVSSTIARRIFDAAMRRLDVRVTTQVSTRAEAHSVTDTTETTATDAAGHQQPTIVLHRPDEFYARVGVDRLIGLGEAYMTGAWDSPDLDLLLTTLAADLPGLVPDWLQRFRKVYQAREPRQQRSSVENSQANISHHYDLSNDLFETFLDPSLTYSSAYFDGLDRTTTPLLEAQHAKIDRMLDQLRVHEGTRLLEVGTGWGELAIRAAARGAVVRSVTLSVEQQELARRRIAAAGYADRVSVEILDYRLVRDDRGFDAIASVEMVEAVGAEFWPEYFRTLDGLLAPGGRACIQAITMPHDRMLATRGGHTWINKYIFPGGFLPSVEVIDQVTREHTRLRVVERRMFGLDYAETLRRWDDAFLAASDEVHHLGFDDTFIRMWHFYLVYSRAGFASGYLDVGQFTMARAGHGE